MSTPPKMTTRAKRAMPVPAAAAAAATASPAISSTTFHPDDESASMASAVAATEAQGSSVREAFRLMATLIYPAIPIAYLDRCARILQRRHMETVFEERSVQLLCAFPPCANKLRGKNAKYRVSLKKKEIYDAHTENQFCSEQCLKKARVFVSRLVTKPPQLMPSLVDTFGSDKPNPFQWEKQQQALALQAAASTHDGAALATSGSNAHRHGFGRRAATAPLAKTVWSKTSDLGIVERPPVAAMAISENAEPAAPAKEFPDAASAVLIEGFVFPSHKKSLAKKVERKWQDTSTSRGDEIVVSDSEESDAGDSDVESSGSSSSSLDLESDFDPDDAEEELISSDDLPLFINLWRMVSSWITHDTTLLVANKPLTQKTESPTPRTAQEKKDRDAADRAAQLVFHERYTAFSLFLGRPLLPVAQQLQLPCDRYATHRIDSLVKSFVFREAIDGRNTQQSHLTVAVIVDYVVVCMEQWSCIAALLLLVAYNKQVSSMTHEMLTAAQRATQLDAHELDQLLALFYTLRNDSEIVVDDDVAARPTDGAASKATTNGDAAAMPTCRRCRRTQAKCVCSTRTPNTKTLAAAPAQAFSTDELAQMFRDAATLREHYEDLVEAAGGNYDDID